LEFLLHPYHPGELLKEELICRHLSQRTLALKLGLSYTMLNEILNGKRTVTTDFALLMEAALGVSSGLLLRMQVSYNIQTARQDKTLSHRLAEVRKICAVM
jgi:addiction module HigA family antidote